MIARSRPQRISVHLQDEIDEYIKQKQHEIDMENHVARNKQKKKIFELIKQQYDANTLTAATLIAILSTLSSEETKYLFAAGVFYDEADTESKAAKFIASLFAELAAPFSVANIVAGDLVNVKIAKKYTQAILSSIARDWKNNPYDEIAKIRLEHELRGMIFSRKEPEDISLLDEFINLLDKKDADGFMEKLDQLQQVCPEYMPELLSELTQHCSDSCYEYYRGIVLDAIQYESTNKSVQTLNLWFFNCHQKLATDIVKEYPHKFFELDSAMQAKVHQNLLLESKQPKRISSILGAVISNAKKFLGLEKVGFSSPYKKEIISSDEQSFFSSEITYSHSSSDSSTTTTSTVMKESTKPTSPKEITITTGISNREIDDKESEVDVIYHVIKDEVQPKLSERQILDRGQTIKDVLMDIGVYTCAQDVKQAKKDFFLNLLHRLDPVEEREGEELSLELIQDCLTKLNKKQRAELFEKWGGWGSGEDTRAAKLLARLYQAVTGIALTKAQMTIMVRDGKLPSLKSEIEKVVLNPLQKPTTKLGEKILTVHKRLHDAQAVLQRTKADELAAEKADYQNCLVNHGFNTAFSQMNVGELCFDTQGRVFVETTLPHDYKNLTKPVICSLDIKNNKELKQQFIVWATSDVEESKIGLLIDAATSLFELPSRSSIIPLQEEMEMHMRLMSRVLEKNEGLMDYNWQAIRRNAAIKINNEIKKVFQQALLANPIINIAALNEKFAAARIDLALFSKQALLEELLNENVGQADLERIINEIDKHAFESTTATGLEFIRTDVDLESCVSFSATDETAHDKKKWEGNRSFSFATRAINRNDYIDGQVQKAARTRLELRVPSIAVQSLETSQAVEDVANKLAVNYDLLQEQMGEYDGPMTYNLLTALNFSLLDYTYDNANRQRNSAARILKGTHVFNRSQILSGKPNSLWFVENISVNQQGINMNYDRWDNAALEAMLMCDISLLNNFNSHKSCLPPAMRDYVKDVYDQAYTEYNHFLQNNVQGDLYFKDSPEGKRVIEQVNYFKEVIKDNKLGLQFDPKAPLEETAMKALMKIMAMGKHGKKTYGPLVQALSIFIERASQHGCKSANEREGVISNAVDLIDSVERMNQKRMNDQLPIDLEEDARLKVIDALASFLNKSDTDDKDKIKKVRDKLNKALNIFNVYGPFASYEDQGASIKLEKSSPMEIINGFDLNYASKGKLGMFDRFNTNIALPREFTNLNSMNVSEMQAHKGDHIAGLKTALAKAVVSVHRNDFVI